MFPKREVYLAGPIAGLTYADARHGWRKDFAALMPEHILCTSPMRSKDFLKDHGFLTHDYGVDYPDHELATDAGITTRGHNDVRTCDAMVACFLESGGRPSLGTAVEYGFAYAYRKPVIAVGPLDDPNIRHPMLRHVAGYHADTLEEAATIVTHILTPGI